MTGQEQLVLRALKTRQGNGVDVYAFFLHGSDITRVADISRVSRDETDQVKGFQRREMVVSRGWWKLAEVA